MSDNNWQQQPQYKTGIKEANGLAGASDALGMVENFFRGMPFGRSQFDECDLNDMIDVIEHGKPEHLEMAGKAIWDARDAISTAAKDLRKYVDQVDWEGEGATSFHKYATSLLKWAGQFEDYAHNVGAEITAAATGLASAHMPPRDTRPAGEQKRPWLLPKAKQVESNPDYVLAQQVEKNRQEAINQMNRLGSYYSVAGGALHSQPKPSMAQIDKVPDFGVPRPSPVDAGSSRYGSGSQAPTASVRQGATGGREAAVDAHGTSADGAVSPLKEVHVPSGYPGHDVGTEINTVGTLPPPAHTAQPGPPTPTLPAAGGGGPTPTPPLGPGPMAPPIAPTVGRATGYSPSGRLPFSTQGRTGPSGTAGGRVPQEPEGQTGRTVSGGRVPQGPIGQAARAMGGTPEAGQSAVRGSAQQAGRSPLGRGVTGGTPRMTNTPGENVRATGPIGAARSGVVGGKPVTGRTPGAASNSRVPRGTVVGAEEPVSSAQPKGVLGQRGVVGAPTAKANPGVGQSVLRSAVASEGAIGVPRNAAGSLGGSESSARGAGLGRGAIGNGQSAKGEAGREGGPAEKQQHRPTQKQRRDVPQKRD
ncbi:hypothetical protein ABT288_29465 [Streptomyces sp. NPDC001093]|uniref:hypothetical protein n=1 Tax=Streptomyces sp. NPDC001093 TaxID=3154376 RepID=UPI0033336BFB